MEDIIKRLQKLKCPKETQDIILTALSEVRLHHDKPKSRDVQQSVYKALKRIVDSENKKR